jgi:uncharacterized protein (DUF983 family)
MAEDIICMAASPGQGLLAMTPQQQPVSLARAMWRGFRMRCPNCGHGRLFGRFLKVIDHCPACGEELFHQRADDFPAYLVIVIVGHLIVPGILAVEIAYRPAYWIHFSIWVPLTIVSALSLLQPVKGAIVGLQWQLGMHGFEQARNRRLLEQMAVQSETPRRAGLASIGAVADGLHPLA